MPKKSLKPSPQIEDAQDTHGRSSKFGQLIGDAFAIAVFAIIKSHVVMHHPEYTVTDAKKLLRLQMMGGTQRQIDNIIRAGEEGDPVALFETKWLKDARHHNDKGAWILQLREISKAYPTIRGTVAILAGYWTEGVAVMFESEGRVRMVQVAKDDEVYQTLQPRLDKCLHDAGLEPLQLDAIKIRKRLPRSKDVAACLTALKQDGTLTSIAESWLQFQRATRPDGSPVFGRDLVVDAIDELLTPLSGHRTIKRFEISLLIDSGNTIYQHFKDAEDLLDFIEQYTSDPQAILDKITPRRVIPNEEDHQS